jgi:regulator of RNase E activity RraA
MYTMDTDIRPLGETAFAITGVATTAKCPPGDNLGLVKALTLVKSGDVLVVDAQGFEEWCLGGYQLLKYAREHNGLAGVIVNGAYRDEDEAQSARFPLYARCTAPYSGPKAGPCEVNVPVCCGGVIVQPGDVISASSEGVVVIPQRSLKAVVDALALGAKAGHDNNDLLADLFAVASRLDCDEISGPGHGF